MKPIRKRLESFKKCDIEIESIRLELLFFERNLALCAEPRISELKKRQEQLIENKITLANIIDQINDPIARSIYRMRYITGEKWETIASKCGKMSERNAHRIHNLALPEVEKLYRKFVLDKNKK